MDTLNDSEVTAQKLEAIFKSAFMPCTVDKDGDVRIEDGGLRVFLRVNSERKYITFFSVYGLRPGVFNDTKKLQFLNKLNDEYRLVRFSMPKMERLWCDYQLLYEGGLLPYQVVNTCRLFISVCKGIAMADTDNLIA